VNPSFNIQAPGIYFDTAQLFVEAGPSGISYVIMNTGNYFQAVVTYSFPDKINDAHLKKIFQNDELLQKKYLKTHIIWSYPESILVPPELLNEEGNIEMLDLIYGDSGTGIIKSDFIYKHNLHNIYRIPETILESFEAKFPYATQTHQYSLLVNRKMKDEDGLFVVFYTNSLTMMLCKEGRLQVIQNFEYSNPDDSAYHLLNACKSFDVMPNQVKLHISGLIDEKSSLYAAIYKYFLHVEFDKLNSDLSLAEGIKNYPLHFFSHLFYQASCV
jgi:hypothetical protein